MLKLDEASLAVFSLQQFFTYNNKKGTAIGLRDKKILNILLIAERAGFMFSALNGNADKYMNALIGTAPSNSPKGTTVGCERSSLARATLPPGRNGGEVWEPFTHEVIPFHEWFAGKMKADLSKYPKPAKPETAKVIVRV